MAQLTVDHDLISPVGDVFHHRALERQLRALLIVVGDLQPRTLHDLTAGGAQFAQQQAQQRALTGAVGANDAYAVAAHYGHAEISDDALLAEAHAGVNRLEDFAT